MRDPACPGLEPEIRAGAGTRRHFAPVKTLQLEIPSLAAQSRLVGNVQVLADWLDSTAMDALQRRRLLLVLRWAALWGRLSSARH